MTCTTLSAASGFTVDVGAITQPGTYDILVSTSGTPTPVLGSNATGSRVTFEWVGNTLQMHVSPTIDSATYDASTGVLTVTGTFLAASGAANDIDVSKLTLTGEGGATYTLTTGSVEISSASSFSITLNATDLDAVNQMLNKNGLSSTSGTSFNLAASEDWNAGFSPAVAIDVDLSNGLTVSNVAAPAISSATYDTSSGVLTVTGTGFLKLSGATNDIDVSKLTLTGEGGTTYALTSSSVEIASGTSFSVTLNPADKAAVQLFLNKNGLTSTSGTSFNLAASEDWAAGADAAVTTVDATNGLTVSNVAIPAISSAFYDATRGLLIVNGTNFLKLNGSANDIDVSKLTLSAGGGQSRTLTSASVEITSGTSFLVTLNPADFAAVKLFLNKNGVLSTSGINYNLAATEDWAAGAASALTTVDAINSLTVANLAGPDGVNGMVVVTGTTVITYGVTAANVWNVKVIGDAVPGANITLRVYLSTDTLRANPISFKDQTGATTNALTQLSGADVNGRWSNTVNLAGLLDGQYVVVATQTDAFGNSSSAGESGVITKDTALPFMQNLGNITTTDAKSYRVSGYARPGATVVVQVGNKTVSLIANAHTGAFTTGKGLFSGTNNVVIMSTSTGVQVNIRQFGGIAGTTKLFTTTINKTATISSGSVAAPVIAAVPANFTALQKAAYTLTGTGVAGHTVTVVFTNLNPDSTVNTVIGSALVDASGNWTMTVNLSTFANANVTALAYQRHPYTGNQSAATADKTILWVVNDLQDDWMQYWAKGEVQVVKDEELSWSDFMDRPSLTDALSLEMDAFKS